MEHGIYLTPPAWEIVALCRLAITIRGERASDRFCVADNPDTDKPETTPLIAHQRVYQDLANGHGRFDGHQMSECAKVTLTSTRILAACWSSEYPATVHSEPQQLDADIQ
jgi:hypothetical protein